MKHQTNSISFNQFVRLPFLGSTWVEREGDRLRGLSFYHLAVHREGDTNDEAGRDIKGAGPIQGVTLRAGRWVVIVDRPHVGLFDDLASPVAWNQTAWLVIAAPLITFAGVSLCLLGSPVRHLVGRLRRSELEAAGNPLA